MTELNQQLVETAKRGANVNATDNWGNTAPHEAAEKDHKDIVKSLLKAGANLEAKDKSGNTALFYAEKSVICMVLKKL
ncbi:hypothetical protein CL658_03990 [bacterium]|nr:hypothetical protein [bacterium]|tara:strand:+ start:2396 stop:2629 length:234 start_codon:yes stop_codon:yes gene_type:complete